MTATMTAAKDNENLTLTLADGRRLGYAEYGDPRGLPIIYCHGFPASRLEARLIDEAAALKHLRILAVDRPGYGLSDFQPDRVMLDWPRDVAEFCRQLHLEKFALLGVSGGGPYALACSARLPAESVVACTLACPLGPVTEESLLTAMRWPGRFSFSLSRRFPGFARRFFGGPIAAVLRRYPQQVLRLLTVSAPPADRQVLGDPALFPIFSRAICEGLRQGGAGVARDLFLYARPWGFDVGTIGTPVEIWQGEEDETVPPIMARFLASGLPRCRLHLFPGEGHFSLPVGHAATILHSLSIDFCA